MLVEHETAAGARQDVGETSRGKVHISQMEDVVLFLSQDGDSGPIHLWRERKAPQSTTAPAAGDQPGAMEMLDTALKDLFEEKDMSEFCADVCAELGVTKLRHLAEIEKEDLDDLPKYLKDKLKPRHTRALLGMIGGKATVARPSSLLSQAQDSS